MKIWYEICKYRDQSIIMRGRPFVVISLWALFSASELHHYINSLVVIYNCVYMRVFGTNTFAGAYSALWPYQPFELSPTSSKEGVRSYIRSFSHTW